MHLITKTILCTLPEFCSGAQGTLSNPLPSTTKVLLVQSHGDVGTANFIKRLEKNVTSFIQMCCKDEQSCSNNSLSLGSDVHSWPLTTKADITSLMKDIKRSIHHEVQLLSLGIECQNHNRSLSMFSQLQASTVKAMEPNVNEQIDSKTQDVWNAISLLSNRTLKNEESSKTMLTELGDTVNNFGTDVGNLESYVDTQISELERNLSNAINELTEIKRELDKPADCDDLPDGSKSGVYEIFPESRRGFKTYCEMDVDGGGWTVVQRRINGEVDFYRTWVEYKKGFGGPENEFWLGNDRLYTLTTHGRYKLRIDITYYNNSQKAYASYSNFDVGHEFTGYELTIDGYSGTAGDPFTFKDAMKNINGMKFSTKDVDNDKAMAGSCATTRNSGWWHNICTNANLNGPYEPEGASKLMYWKSEQMNQFPRLKYTRMMIKNY